MKNNRVGEVYINKDGSSYKIIEYNSYRDCTVEFECGLIKKHQQYGFVKRGGVKNPLHPFIFGVGFFGIGDFHQDKFKNGFCRYNIWKNMLDRCYSELEKFKMYKDVTVCEKWHNFQNFAQWFEDNYKPEYMKGWQLDKDILSRENKTYSPETCCFVPAEINSLFINLSNNKGKCKKGVIKHKDVFRARVCKNGIMTHIGLYSTEIEAFQVYKIEKEKYIKEVADKWKDLIEPRVYKAMYNYKITDENNQNSNK